MKWIGQHIVDFIARFRSDVYLENIADGTVDSDKFLGLDSNNKIVKETVAAGVTISDSTANTDFPVVFHDESNNLHDDTAAFTYNPSTGNAVVPKIQTAGNIELGHASDTTVARSAAGKVTIEGNQIITAGDEVVSTGEHILKQTKVTFDQAACNNLHTGTVSSRTLVAAQGANKMIVPTEIVVFADRASTSTTGHDLVVAYNGSSAYATSVKYARRFMHNVGTDRTKVMGPYVGTVANDLTTPVNSALTATFSASCTNNSLTSLTFYTSYYVIDIS
tara:strand:+ start:49 stop:879 length:831 start_codon:yes stop_codon:yes gene_type:complete